MPHFYFQHTNNVYQVIFYTTALLCFPKNLIPWRDSNPGLLVPEADAMSIAPRRQGGHTVFVALYISCQKSQFGYIFEWKMLV
jgi:hypothetical protein